MKIKVFYGSDIDIFTEKVNSFIADKNVIDIKYAATISTVEALIMYNDIPHDTTE